MTENQYAKRILNIEPGGKRERGRLILRWTDGMVVAFKTLGCKNWRMMAPDRNA